MDCSAAESVWRIPTEDAKKMRSVSSHHVLAGFGRVFAETLSGQVAAADDGTEGESPHYSALEGDVHEEADRLFATSVVAEEIDVMVSHTWSAGRGLKTLALLYYLNGNIAVWACVLASFAGAAYSIIVWGHLDYTALGGNPGLVWAIQIFPVGVYVFFICFGHVLFTCLNQTWWLDKLCIHQSRQWLKARGVARLPEVVQKARRMVVLWNDTYFNRLWCCDELATFTATHSGADEIDFVPLWLFPWILTTMLCECLSSLLSSYFVVMIPLCAKFAQERQFSPDAVVFFQYTVGIGVGLGTAMTPTVLGTYVCMNRKLLNHKIMIQQLDEFSLAKAQCAFESDREWVEEHVRKLFKHIDAKDPIYAFDSYMRNEVKSSLINRLGAATDMKIGQCWLAMMPTFLGAIQNTLSCDLQDCYETYKDEGETSVQAWMAGNLPGYFIGTILCGPPCYVMMLKTMAWISRRVQNCAVKEMMKFVSCVFYTYVFMFSSGAFNGLGKNAKLSSDSVWKVALLLHVGLFTWLNITFFCKRRARPACSKKALSSQGSVLHSVGNDQGLQPNAVSPSMAWHY